jgi:hypothetical protein
MFGRGVRLKGKGRTLKRSSALEGIHPCYIPALETLNVFGIEANYMMEFKDMLGVEGLPPSNISYSIPIKINKELLSQKLLIPDVDKTKYYREALFPLEAYKVTVDVDLTPIIEVISADKNQLGISSESSSRVIKINPELIEAVNWQKIYLNLLEYRAERGLNNIIITEKTLKNIIQDNKCYTLKCPPQYANPSSFQELRQLETIITLILKKYFEKYNTHMRNEWVNKNLEIKVLTADSGNLDFSYDIKVNDTEFNLKNGIESLIQDHLDQLYNEFKDETLINVYFDRHIYQPLIALTGLQSGLIKVQPKDLNRGELRFIYDLKKYVESRKEELKDSKLYILRNLPKRGIGFYDLTNYYPDFIIWIKTGDKQKILFVDPKGLAHMNNGFEAEEIKLHKIIKKREDELRSLYPEFDISLDSFIVSVTTKQDADGLFSKGRTLSYDDYLTHNIVFEEDPQHIVKIFNKIYAN